ncbi:MAG: FAD-binding protein [Anaerolineales bacterium]|nr:FAD-binding protein [Anaerolineales bacterium]
MNQKVNQEFIQAMRDVLPEVRADRMTRLLYSTDASIYQMMPIAVALPRDAEEISAAISVAREHGVPVLPRGGGSSLAGQAVGHALILDLSRYMDKVLEIDPEARTVRTQPGISLGLLNKELGEHGLAYGPDPASADRATIGGILSNNSTGAHSIVYGMTVDHVLSTDIVLADGSHVCFDALNSDTWESRTSRPGLEGTIYQGIPDILNRYQGQIATRYPKTFRHVAGYNLNQLAGTDSPNLAKLIVGSEGTLGVITEATLNLVPIPKVKRLAMVHFHELRAAMEAVSSILECSPSAIEVLDKMMLDLTRDRIEYRRLLTFVEGDPEIVLLVEFAGNTESEIDHGIERLNHTLSRVNHHNPVIIVSDPIQQANVWFVRKVGLGILMSIRGDAKPIPFIEDAAVPVEHLADYISEIYDFAYGVGVERVAMYAHASAGCIHVRPLVNLKTAQGVRQLRQIAERSVELVVQYQGTTSGEHGEGLARGEFSEALFGPELVQAFHEVKDTFDPECIMNPGKVVDVPPHDDERLLRFGTNYAVPYEPAQTLLNFKFDGGFAGAVEMCNGAGVCRKLGEGVMCPSFQALRDETHSTRGRANALRSAMMGLLGSEGMTSKELYEVLDLCLSCKACGAECPSAVDMAKLKAEFLHGYFQEHGAPLRTQIFGNIAKFNRFGQPFATLTNALLKWPGSWLSRSIGVHPNRSIPRFAPQSFSSWYQKRGSNGNEGAVTEANQVVFFHDTFMEHNNPQIGKAAIQVLEAAGYEPILLQEKACCGRPAISKGLLEEAQNLARHNVDLLIQYAEQGIPIVGCEPSCVAMLVDEYVDLVPGDTSKTVAEMTMTLDKFLVSESEAGRLNLNFVEAPRQVLYHGHCQQKAVFGTESTIKMLNLIPNTSVEEIASGCCGMAGSFGYEKEHYDLSIQLVEMSLAPAVRAAPEDIIICASGTSCRDQIDHTTERKPLHPIEVLAGALK